MNLDDRDLRRLRAALEVGTRASGFWRAIRDPDSGRIVDIELVEANASTAEYFGWDLDDLRGRRYSEIVPEGMVERLPRIAAAIDRGEATQLTVERTTGTGYTSTFEIRIAPCGEDEVFSAIWDVGERVEALRGIDHARAAAEDARAMLAVGLELTDTPFAAYQLERDAAGRVVDARLLHINPAGTAIGDVEPEQLFGRSLRELLDADAADQIVQMFEQAAGSELPLEFTVPVMESIGPGGTIQCRIAPFGADRVAIVWGHDAAEETTAAPRRRSLPGEERRDPLTGLPTRAYFRLLLRDRIAALAEGRSWYLVTLDLDGFGVLNDAVGVREADHVLVRVANGLPTLDPTIDLVGRVGPDEFAFVIGMRGAFDEEAFDRRLAGLLQMIDPGHPGTRLRASGGARRITDDVDVDQLLRDCDTALRYAVAGGGGHVEPFAPGLRERLLTVEIMAEEIYRGIAEHEFHLLYQPVYRLADRTLSAHEALLRWDHPTLGLMPPAAFVPVAESSGAIVHLGGHVLELAMRMAEDDGVVAVNVSAVQLMDYEFVGQVARVLARTGVPAERLILEVTESAALDESRRLRDHVRTLRALGVRFALDDFGAGYSSIRHLDRVQVDYVKFDATLIRGEMTPARVGVFEAAIDMARAIGAETVIEGIETEDQYALALYSGAQFGQGYLFGRPEQLPADVAA